MSELYRRITARMWVDGDFQRLSGPQPNAKDLWVYLLTGMHTTPTPGLYPATQEELARKLRWDPEGFRKVLRELIPEGYPEDYPEGSAEPLRKAWFEADWEAGVVWISNAFFHNEPQSPKVVKGWKKHVDLVPECELKTKALRELRGYCYGKGAAWGKAFDESFAKAKRKSMPKNMAISGTGTGTGIIEPSSLGTEPKSKKTEPRDPVFDHWVHVMGKDHARTKLNGERRKKLRARRAEGYTDEQLCQAVDGCKLSAFHMGANDRREVYNDLAVILRDGTTVEKHIERAAGTASSATPRVSWVGGMP